MTREKCYDLAEQLGLDIVSVTKASNGYPHNVQLALIGFDNFDQAEDVANANDLTIVSIYKRDGWNIWAEQGAACAPIKLGAEDYGDDYMSFDSSWDEDDITDDLRRAIDDIEELDGIFNIVDFYKKLKEEFDKISEDEQVIARMYDADSIEVIKKEVMSWHDDANSSTTAIALI